MVNSFKNILEKNLKNNKVLTTSEVASADFISIFASHVRSDDEVLSKVVLENSSAKKYYLHAFADSVYEQAAEFIKYEVGTEEGVIALLAHFLIEENDTLSEELQEFLDELDDGYLSAESNVGEEELEDLVEDFNKASKAVLYVGEDVIEHPQANNIAQLICMIANYTKMYVVLPQNLQDITPTNNQPCINVEEVEDLPAYNGCISYLCKKGDSTRLFGSKQFAMAAKVQDGMSVTLAFDGQTFNRTFVIDSSMKGTVALLTLTEGEHVEGYRFKTTKISING